MPVLDHDERAVLQDADVELSNLQRALEAAAESDALDPDTIERLKVTAEQTVARLNTNLPPQIDAEAGNEIRRRLIDLLTLAPAEGDGWLDLADRALIETEAVRHVVRDLLDEQPPASLRDAGQTLGLLEQWLPGLGVRELAELLGVSVRQLQRRRQDGGDSTPRMQLVARLVALLRHGWTDQGVYAWFQRPRADLGGRSPIAALDDPDAERRLLLLARAGRVQGGL